VALGATTALVDRSQSLGDVVAFPKTRGRRFKCLSRKPWAGLEASGASVIVGATAGDEEEEPAVHAIASAMPPLKNQNMDTSRMASVMGALDSKLSGRKPS